jgi:hypothetical protein
LLSHRAEAIEKEQQNLIFFIKCAENIAMLTVYTIGIRSTS